MELTQLTALSPIDGRYRKKVEHLDEYFAEYALIKYRVLVEVEYFFFLADQKFFKLPLKARHSLRSMLENFSIDDANQIKLLESVTNHDVKAVEYFLKEQVEKAGVGQLKEWIHFGLTSQDINNTAIPLSWKHAMEHEYLPSLINLQNMIYSLATQWKDIPLLARTHGQAASPTKLGKEFMVFVERIHNQIELFSSIPYAAKFGGATGNFNAHHIAFPKKNWVLLGNKFVEDILGLQRMQFTTQIEHYDSLAAHFDALKRINNILIDLCRDIWTYISMDYFKQQTKKGEVGSSAMPHKVNPIDFENAEGNLGIANSLLEHLSGKLPISRLQRDLTDSTVLRNMGVPMGHISIAIQSLEKGLSKLILNEQAIKADLENNWPVVAEAIQTILRRENYPNPYEALKDLTRGKQKIDKIAIHQFINSLKISPALKKELKAITPSNYTGVNPAY
ncbi:MAG: adenylosuccinate lyase [Sphingobacteriia bacterium 24-36-13]|jgi:adenylosuccinate lyase|uniref:adenylosuccinate lyase n=1 Tax=Sediminibacterium sp. TaxID=1917865 RepID=UPI000BCC42D8|nr:adenylosuccinate lyase [Sediminibacterium sp.]OYY11847.1 MAG: adenylosuccinate lyase [Sphingobacteriia bacterium 35-36-14]OYZ54542.1 MAG: adenylosuccinate lyase [Sphingobacteriia bacterium 24-36-13]OZA64392.1 MAG: adenylosuccinate lyase [Sphingobacteriia bacterium 39-36-14]HQS23942.1 adenylosuccinate lyase [Sediminibacterium sp.]HQS35278.1 adenylosuccinate lyase [Sediminibacterium sp.]